MAQNFNNAPYYDDFDPNKNFHRILFKPGTAVQARELTQSQTILQDQISKFASSIFSQNTPISGGKVTTNLNCDYLKLNYLQDGVDVTAENFKNKIIQDSTGTIVAKVIETSESTGTELQSGDYPTLIITYLSGETFSDATQIFTIDSAYTASTIGTAGGTTCTGKSSIASISEGVFYVIKGYNLSNIPNEDGSFNKYSIGNFVSNLQQSTILSKYSNAPSCRVGLLITESIVDYIQDSSILDPAVGASNYQAPGADRYKVSLTLTTLSLDPGDDDGFIELVRIENGKILKQTDSTVYSTIDDYFAKRTYDTSGDFVISDFTVSPVANTVNSNKYDTRISKGVAYIQGYKVENQSDIIVTNDRARTSASQNNNPVYVDYGSYFYVDTLKGAFDVTTVTPVDLHVVRAANLVTSNTTTYNSTKAGTAYIRALEYVNDTVDSDTESYVYKAFLYDIKTNTISGDVVSAVASPSLNGSTITLGNATALSTVTDAYAGVTLTIDSGPGAGYSGSIVSYNVSTKTVTVDKTFSTGLPTSQSVYSLRFSTSDVDCVANTLSGTTTVKSRANINASSKVNGVATNKSILENPNVPELVYNIGYPYISGLSAGNYESAQVFRNQPFSGGTLTIRLSTLNPALTSSVIAFEGGTGTISSDSAKQNFIVIDDSTGNVLDFATSGNTVTISSDKNQVTFSSGTYISPTVTVIAKVNALNADSAVFLRTKTLVTTNQNIIANTGPDGIISSNTYVDLTNGQVYIKNVALTGVGQKQSLYVSDVKRIVKIIDTKSPSVEPTISMLTDSSYDVTTHYNLNTGQKDAYYDHAFLSLNPGNPKPKGNLLVLFDFYNHGGGDGYFSYSSYLNESYAEIPSYVATNGKRYNLRDSIDFRPSRKNGTADFDFTYTANPSNKYTGVYIPQDLTNWYSNYSYYLGRKDKLVLSKDKSFQIIQGTPSVTPQFPTEPDGSLVLASLTHDPYTAYIPSEAPAGTLPNLSIEKVMHKRWTMSDISDLQTRVNNIEYYTSLNLLEQKSQTLQVTDINGLNRFKNGILVDSFTSYATADTSNPDFFACIDRVNGKMTPTQTVTNYPLQSVVATTTLNRPSASANSLGFQMNTVGKTTNIFTMPYSTTEIIKQQLASNTVNLNPFTTPTYAGVCHLNPPMDNWVDNEKQPDLLIVDPNIQIYQQSDTLNVLSAGNWQTISGSQRTITGPTTFTEGHNINWSPFGFVGFSATNQTTITTINQQKTTVTGYWQNLGNSYTTTNGFITDISIQPYIRAQNIVVRAKSMKINTPVSTSFDGVNVDNYMLNPDAIELTNSTGTFNEDDVIGIYDFEKSVFKPVGVVISTYKYPSSANVRLYIVSNFHSAYYQNPTYTFDTISNAVFDTNGNYVRSTATGKLTTTNVINVHKTGTVTAVGGTYLDYPGSTNSIKYYFIKPWSDSTAFVNKYAIWGSPQGFGALPAGRFYFNVPSTGTYQLRYTMDERQSGYIRIDGTTYWTSGGGYAIQLHNITLTAGSHYLDLYMVGDHEDGDAHLALTLARNPNSSTSRNFLPNDSDVILHTRNLIISGSIPSNVGSVINMPGGGYYFVGATKISLSGIAQSANAYYAGCSVTVSAGYVSNNLYGTGLTISKTSQKVTVTAYDSSTRTLTLSAPVNVSMGINTQYGNVDSTYTLEGTYNNYLLGVKNGGALSKMSTDENGNFVGIFSIPPNTFRTGERVFRVDNRTTPDDPASATTWSEATFTASGLSTKSQALNFSPSISSAKNVFTTTETRQNVVINVSTIINPWDPVAQTFIIDKVNYPNGAFLSSAKFFFKNKPTTTNLPVTLSIVNTLNGYPSGDTLDNSIVTLSADKVKVSNNPHYLDANTYTQFTFDAPVFIQPNVLYAFILQSPSSDYDVYIAAQNATALGSSAKKLATDPNPTTITKIGNSPYVGSLFESQNAITWTAEQTKSLMFVVDRCVFNTSASTKVAFSIPKGLPTRKFATGDIEAYYSPTYVNNVSGTMSYSDVVCDALNISTTDYVPTGTGISYTFKPTLKSTEDYDNERSVTPGKFGTPTFDNVYLDDGKGQRLLKANSDSSFLLYATMTSTSDTVSPIVSDDGLALYNVKYNINNLGLSNNSISLIDGGTGYNVQTLSINVTSPDIPGGSQAALSANVAANGVIDSVFVTSPGAGYLKTPMITISDDTTRSGNSNASVSLVSEYSPQGGNALTRYVTKKVTLTSGNDSKDLRVFFSAYRPINTNIYVFYRIQSRNDTQIFENGSWQLMTYVNNSGNGISQSREQILEFEAAPGVLGSANGIVSYTSTDGTTYNDFNQFAIKIVMTTPDNTSVPYLTDLRVLALPSFTGI